MYLSAHISLVVSSILIFQHSQTKEIRFGRELLALALSVLPHLVLPMAILLSPVGSPLVFLAIVFIGSAIPLAVYTIMKGFATLSERTTVFRGFLIANLFIALLVFIALLFKVNIRIIILGGLALLITFNWSIFGKVRKARAFKEIA
jgi:hypothetical protein